MSEPHIFDLEEDFVKSEIDENWKGYIPLTANVITHILPSLCLHVTGHKLNLSNIMTVLKEVKDMKAMAKHLKMSKERSANVFVGTQTEIMGKCASFWLETFHHWCEIKDSLLSCGEFASAEIAELMEQYNFKGML